MLYFTVTLPVLFNATKIGIGRILNICWRKCSFENDTKNVI